MNEIEEQKRFNQKRRQHFLSKDRYLNKLLLFKKNIIINNDDWESNDLERRNFFKYKADDLWDLLRIDYTAGEPISKLPLVLDEIINVLEVSSQFWQQNKEALNQIGYYTAPMPWFYVEHYLKVLGLISVCYLLQREDLLKRLLQVILDNAADGLEPDSTIEDFFYYRFKDREDPDYVQFGEYAALLSNAMRDDDKAKQLRYLDTYLKDWYQEMVGMV
ncbi:hypothetical protein, partial [Neisseria sp. MVDL20-010259]|uniref:hypothetical protein n=1 Tax=Neisseria sp. MVDL20-010259 TaxID=3061170 RepID=UPI00265F6506